MRAGRMTAALLAAALVLAVGCGSKDKAQGGGETSVVTNTAAQLADDMLAVFQPQGELLEVADSVLDNYYALDANVITGHKIYISSSFIAEEIAVFSVAEGKETEAEKMLTQRLADLKASFDGYLPDELQSLEDNARILTGGGRICLLAGKGEGLKAAEKVFADATK